ncbi:hypothetical protein DDE18_08465 [Nocardioides gansuensis]|uniref:Uncharacterized protein n=1 Tax=Nocardioides gansuensis TaxID=2138300 RepID=A0A2T8FC77_9ACTN|nr:hypothetical protein DDE18_08465 [Nocardioides gansuensis]
MHVGEGAGDEDPGPQLTVRPAVQGREAPAERALGRAPVAARVVLLRADQVLLCVLDRWRRPS